MFVTFKQIFITSPKCQDLFLYNQTITEDINVLSAEDFDISLYIDTVSLINK